MMTHSPYSVLFICTANRCRSPMAEALFKRILSEQDRASVWLIQSAGTWAEPGLPATVNAQAALAAQGIDLSLHRSQLLTADLLRSTAVILVMTCHHQEAIQAEFPEVAHKTFLLSQLIGQEFDIEDPYGSAAEEYRRCADDIEHILRDGFPHLRELAEGISCIE